MLVCPNCKHELYEVQRTTWHMLKREDTEYFTEIFDEYAYYCGYCWQNITIELGKVIEQTVQRNGPAKDE